MNHPFSKTTSRRAAIRAGGLSLLGLGTNHLSMIRDLAAKEGTGSQPRAKSVIYIFLSGGLAQHESFDMKPDAPSEIRGEFSEIATKTPGLRICEHLPELAKRSELWSICRSLTHGSNEHSQAHHIMLTGHSDIPPGFDPTKPKDSDWPSMASIIGQSVKPKNNLPPAIMLPEKIIHRTGRTLPGQFGGQMGPEHDPFFVDASKYNPQSYGAYPDYLFHHEKGQQNADDFDFNVPNFSMPEGVDFQRMQDRVSLLSHLDGQHAALEKSMETRLHDRYQEMATDLLFDQKTKAAFDISLANPKLKKQYGENAFGWSLLMASQLVESGVPFVQVNLGNNECWDTHQAAFPNLKNFLLPPMDMAVSALLDDLSSKGMLDDTLVIMGSEFGRTPKISTLRGKPLPGRDHWGAVQTVFMAGGGVKGGRVLGSSDKIGGHPASDAKTPEDFAATIYDALGLPKTLKWYDTNERPHFLYHGEPMSELF